MATGWAFFQEYGTGGLSSAGWIRPGSVVGSVFAWLHDAIPFPVNVWTYRPDYTGTGYIVVDPLDPDYVWVAACVDTGGINLFTRCYTYRYSTDTWTLLLDVPFVGPSTPLIVDMCFDTDGTAFLAVGGNGAYGLGGGVGEGGIYKSVARGAFTGIGSGHEHGYNSGNINGPASLTALDIAPTTEEGSRVLYTAHTLTRLNGLQPTGWVTSSSADDGASWHDPVPTYNGNQFRLECLTVLRLVAIGGGLWYVADNSGTGAYSTANLSARIDGTPSNGPTGSYGGGIADSGSIAYPFSSDPTKGVAFPTAFATTLVLYSTVDEGGSWVAHSQGLEHAPFGYRGGRTLDGTLTAAGVSQDNASHLSEIWWTEDGGLTWHSATAEENAIGLSWAFGPFNPSPSQVWLEVLTFRDSRMFAGQTRYYVGGVDETEARGNALAIAALLTPLSNGQWTGASGPYNTPPLAPTQGADALYQNIEEVIRLTWITADGVAIYVEVPCPKSALFLDDQESLALLNPAIAAVSTGVLSYKLCTRGGALAVSFIGATRIMRGFRATQTMRTLDPSETSTGE
jgi:hypothetical protein